MYNVSASHTAVQELEYSEVYYTCTPKYHKLVKMKDLCFSETITLKIAVKRELSKERERVSGSKRLYTDCLLALLDL